MREGRKADLTLSDPRAWQDPWRSPLLYEGLIRRRLIAYLIDLFFLSFLGLPIWLASTVLGIVTFGLTLPASALLIALVPILYHGLFVGGSGAATLGMRICGLRVASQIPDGTMLPRPSITQGLIMAVCFYGSMSLTGGLVILFPLFNPRRRMLHDFLSGIAVVCAKTPSTWDQAIPN